MRVYIAMPINTASGYKHDQMFQRVGEIVRQQGLEPILPTDDVSPQTWNDMMHRYQFDECCRMLVESDLANLRQADALLAIIPNASVGTAMEIAYARLWGKRVVMVTSLQTFYHPWLWYHGHVIWSTDPFEDGVIQACEYLNTLR